MYVGEYAMCKRGGGGQRVRLGAVGDGGTPRTHGGEGCDGQSLLGRRNPSAKGTNMAAWKV